MHRCLHAMRMSFVGDKQTMNVLCSSCPPRKQASPSKPPRVTMELQIGMTFKYSGFHPDLGCKTFKANLWVAHPYPHISTLCSKGRTPSSTSLLFHHRTWCEPCFSGLPHIARRTTKNKWQRHAKLPRTHPNVYQT